MTDNNISQSERGRMHPEHAKKELDLMQKAIDVEDYKKALHHKVMAGVAIDEMVNVSKLVEENDGKKN